MYKQLTNKNFLNNQNYIITKKIKINLLFDYFFKREIGDFSINFINYIIKFLLFFIIKIFYNKKIGWYHHLVLSIFFVIILYPLYKIFIPFYIVINIYLSFFTINMIEDFSLSKVYILDIRNKSTNKYFKYNFLSSLIEYVSFSDKIQKNNSRILLNSILYFCISNSFLITFLYIYA